MAMKAHVRTDSMGNITLHINGGIDYENTIPLKKQLVELASQNPASTITLDMNNMEFVGSSGIGFFVDMIKSLNSRKEQIKLSNVKSEFLKVFKLFDGDIEDFIIHEFETDETEGLSQRFAARKRTFQN